jgi:hypothetical protein
MFVQVIEGRTHDPREFRRMEMQWESDVHPGATGFLGSTVGVTDDGRFVVMARFDDEQSARTNSDRPEQRAWYDEFVTCLDGEPTFKESSDVDLLFEGAPDRAGFVQVMEGKVLDRAKAEAMESPEMLEQLHKVRPDLLGGVRVWLPHDEFVDVAYFTSEAEARRNEHSAEFEAGPGEDLEGALGDMTYLDIKDPILIGA